MKHYYVYIVSSYRGTLYTGVTNDLERRVAEHRGGVGGGFTGKYKTSRLVYFDATNDVVSAIEREKQIKGWPRARKVELIEADNPEWSDLSLE